MRECTNLKDESHYSDRYDLGTIQSCLSAIKTYQGIPLDKFKTDAKEMSDDEKRRCFEQALNFELYYIKGERYCNKSNIVHGWREKDKNRDDFYRNTRDPADLKCANCSAATRVILKQLHERSDSPLRVLFMLECVSCKKRKAVFDNGEKFVVEPEHCPDCNKVIKVNCRERGKNLIWSKKCSACGFSKTEVDDFESSRKEREKRELEEAQQLKDYRGRFCLSPEEGADYIISKNNLKQLEDIVKKAELKQKDPDYKKADSLKRWSVADLEKELSAALDKKKYSKLSLEKPEIDRFVVVPFLVQDFDSTRDERDSTRKLRKLIQSTLSDSNWRLMSDGVSYRLGFLSGRLKGYEREEDMVRLIKDEKVQCELEK